MSDYGAAGNYILKELVLENFQGDQIDVSELFVGISYVEDIFAPTIFGSIAFVDALDLVQNFPIIGQEKLIFRYQTHNTSDIIDRVFYTYKTANREANAQESTTYTLPFTSRETLVDQNTRVSQSFRGLRGSQIVRAIYDTYLTSNKPIRIGDTVGLHSVVIPNWNPIETINWVGSFCMPASHDRSHFLFYENATGFVFRHLEDMIDDEPVKTIETKLANVADGAGSDGQMRPGDCPATTRIIKQADVLKGIADGAFGTRVIAYDNVSKELRTIDTRARDSFNRESHLGTHPMVADNFEFDSPEQSVTVIPSTTLRDTSGYFRDREGMSQGLGGERVAVSRSRLISEISAIQGCIELPGDVDIQAGVNITFLLPNRTAVDSESDRDADKFIRQKVMVSKVINRFSRGRHWMTVYFLKDSLDSKPENRITGQGSDKRA